LVARPAGRVVATLWPVWCGGVLFAVSMLPALPVLGPVWEHRQRWAAFAAGTGVNDVLHLLPLAAFLGPLAIGACLHGLFAGCQRRGAFEDHAVRRQRSLRGVIAWFATDASDQAHETRARRGDQDRQWWMWLLAWLLPCLAVYLLTASGIAPLMHRRYVFVAAAPFVLWIASSVIRLQGRGLRLAVLLAMVVVLLYQQGSLRAWREGDWPAAVRGEDWRGAVQWINSQTSRERPVVVFCASNLIEGAGEIPTDEALREYLTLPLRSVYRVEAAKRIVPLANEPVRWASTIAAERVEHGSEPAWLVVRCSAAGLERRLQASGLIVGERRDFGGVQVARAVRVASEVGF
jgi:hypothetical protein